MWFRLCRVGFTDRMAKRNRPVFDYNKNRAWAENLTIVMQIGLTMAGCIGFCFFVGLTIDRWANTRGVFVTVFTVLGVVGGGNVVYRQILEIIETPQKGSEDRNDDVD